MSVGLRGAVEDHLISILGVAYRPRDDVVAVGPGHMQYLPTAEAVDGEALGATLKRRGVRRLADRRASGSHGGARGRERRKHKSSKVGRSRHGGSPPEYARESTSEDLESMGGAAGGDRDLSRQSRAARTAQSSGGGVTHLSEAASRGPDEGRVQPP